MSQFTTEVEFDGKKKTPQEKSWPDQDGCTILTRLAKRTGGEPWESSWVLEISPISLWWARSWKSLCQLFILQTPLQVLASCWTESKYMSRLQSISQQSSGNHGLWYFRGHFVGQWNAVEFSGIVRAFIQFHVYFTVRRILYQLGGIQSVGSLPGELTFSQTSNKYYIPSYKSIWAEFEVEPTTDFRFTHGQNHRLGYVYIIYDGGSSGPSKKWTCPPATLSNPSSQRFADECGAGKGKGKHFGFTRNELLQMWDGLSCRYENETYDRTVEAGCQYLADLSPCLCPVISGNLLSPLQQRQWQSRQPKQ